MKSQEAASRYSRALFALGGSREKRLSLLLGLLEAWNKFPKFQNFLNSPFIPIQEKMDMLAKISDDQQLLAFFNLVIENNRTKDFPAITEDYRKLVVDSLGVMEITLRTAIPIDEKEKTKLQKKLEKSQNKKVHIHEIVDPTIMGGAILSFGNKMIDCSISQRLETLRKELCK